MLTHGGVTLVYEGDSNRVGGTASGVATKFLVDTLNPTGYSQVMDQVSQRLRDPDLRLRPKLPHQ